MKTSLLILLAVARLLLLLSARADSNVILHLSFDEDFATAGYFADGSGNSRHGYLYQPSTNRPISTNGVFGNAAYFWTNSVATDGQGHFYATSQYAAVTNTSALTNMTAFTISVWAKFLAKTNGANSGTNMGTQVDMYLVDAGYQPQNAGSGATNSWRLGRNPLGRQVNLRAYAAVTTDSDGDAVTVFDQDTISSTDYRTAAWHMYSVVVDCAANTSKGYYDGALVKTGTALSVPYLEVWDYMCIGAAAHNGTPQWDAGQGGGDIYPNDMFFFGFMDELWEWSRALSATEVSNIYTYNSVDGASTPAVAAVSLGGSASMVGNYTIR